ncbi:hypothetical protein SAY86_030974 [Trapa natans]|uniref:Uncharacterized protein n=1 Tax=Trapa natans TaxID=22666 RepID=A0AAN7RJ24_TRANT|nr:hypothetical protein SAY86_030974 [Trapa natans]
MDTSDKRGRKKRRNAPIPYHTQLKRIITQLIHDRKQETQNRKQGMGIYSEKKSDYRESTAKEDDDFKTTLKQTDGYGSLWGGALLLALALDPLEAGGSSRLYLLQGSSGLGFFLGVVGFFLGLVSFIICHCPNASLTPLIRPAERSFARHGDLQTSPPSTWD